MQSTTPPPLWAQLLPLLVVVVIMTIRFLRPQRISVMRMWLQPLILCAIAGWLIYATNLMNPSPLWGLAVSLIVGVILGIPFGILRGWHTDVRPTERPGVMYLGASWITMAVFFVAFGLRFGIRAIVEHTGGMAAAAPIGDGSLAFAIAFVVASYVVIYRKYQEEVAGKLTAPPAPPA